MPTPSTSAYDLTLAEGDFAPWRGSPRRSIVICSHPRSGTTMLGETIRFAGGLGCPLEYLHGGFRPGIAERWQTPDLESYVAAMHRHRTDTNGVFSIKLFWQDIQDLAHERSPDRFPPRNNELTTTFTDDGYREIWALLGDILPNPEFLHVERRDRVRQAVSAVTAADTGLWRAIPGVGRQEALREPEYDYDRLLGLVAFADYSHDHWRGFFAANGLVPARLTYEELVSDYDAVAARLLAALGAANATPLPRRTKRQSDTRNEAMVLRFLRDYATRAA